MKQLFIVLGLVATVFFANALLTISGCNTPGSGESSSSISNTYAILPTDLAAMKQADANLFSWQTFIAVNWPANISTCGADTSNGNNILSGKGPVVWETYLNSEQVFVTAPAVPDSWCMASKTSNHFKSLPQKVQDLANKTGVYRFIHRTSKSPHGLDQAVGGPLVDQNGRFVRYEVRINQDEYNYITKNTLWDTAGQRTFSKTSTVSFPAGPTAAYGPVGAMEFKAAWKILGKGDDPSRFYKIQAIVYNDDSGDPSPGENPVTLGLVGLHIAHKTATQGDWVWSTFEQVDNLTKSFYNPGCKTCPVNQPIQGSNIKELDPSGKPLHAPTQVTRVNPVNDPSADSLNTYFQTLLKGSVWANYKLISTQWMLFEDIAPPFLASSVQETYIQGPHPASYGKVTVKAGQNYFQSSEYNPFAPGISASCMACHYAAALPIAPTMKADFSFLLYEAKH
jgi:hypothetical protein